MKTYRILIAVMFISLSSCSEDWLELKPIGQNLETNYYKTEEQIFRGLIATYSMLQPKYFSGWSSYYFLANFPSDDSKVVGGGPNDRPEYHAIAEFRMLPTNTAVLQLWRRGFYGISRANTVINNADPEASQTSREYIAEAKFLRAHYYFELVRFFGDVPLILETLSPSEYNQKRIPAGEVLEQVIKDLKEAESDLAVSPPENYRVTRGAGNAMLGKVYLYMASPWYQQKYDLALSSAEYYNLAKAEFEKVIGSGLYDLEPVYDNVWRYEYEHGAESIFEIEYANIDRGGDWGNGRVNGGNIDVQMSGPRGISTDTLNSGWGFDMVTENLIAAYDSEGDVIRKNGTAYGGAFLNQIGASGWEQNEGFTGWFSKKRAPWAHITSPDAAEWNYETNERIIRYADVLLMMSEAIIGSGTGDPDVHFNKVRERAGLDPITGVTLEDIKKERRLELAMEGFRYFDLVRWGDAADVLGDKGFVEGKHEVFPIPQEEIINSDFTLSQNDNY